MSIKARAGRACEGPFQKFRGHKPFPLILLSVFKRGRGERKPGGEKGRGAGDRRWRGRHFSQRAVSHQGESRAPTPCPSPLFVSQALPRVGVSSEPGVGVYSLLEGVGVAGTPVGARQGGSRESKAWGGGLKRESNQWMRIHFVLRGGFYPKETLNFVV